MGFTEEQAKAEAMRCLECGCHDFFDCKLIKYANKYNVKPENLMERSTAETMKTNLRL